MDTDYTNYAFIIIIILIALLLPGCAGNRIFKNENVKIYVLKSERWSPEVFKAKVEYQPSPGQGLAHRYRENIKLECLPWKITIYDRQIFNKNDRVIMTQFFSNNEVQIQSGTLGAVLYEYFCLK